MFLNVFSTVVHDCQISDAGRYVWRTSRFIRGMSKLEQNQHLLQFIYQFINQSMNQSINILTISIPIDGGGGATFMLAEI